MYLPLIYPYLTYGCILWGNNYENPLSDVVRLQNKVVRIINDVPIQDHITSHYINLHLLKFPDIVKLHVFFFMITFITRNVPSFHFPLYQSNIIMLLLAPLQTCYRFLYSELISVNFVLLLLDSISGMTFLQIFEQSLTRNYLRKPF